MWSSQNTISQVWVSILIGLYKVCDIMRYSSSRENADHFDIWFIWIGLVVWATIGDNGWEN